MTLLLSVAIVVLAVAFGTSERDVPSAQAGPGMTRDHGARMFSPQSFWNATLPPNAPLDRASPTLIAALNAEVDREQQARIGPWIQTDLASTPLYVVPRVHKRSPVTLDPPDEPWRATLRKAFRRVPIPRDARPAAGTDGHMTIWQPSTDRLWEFWRIRREPDGWHAAWGGAIEHVSRNEGYYTPAAWPGAQTNWGASASSLPVIGGTIRLRDLERGRIDHALALALPFPRRGVFAWPAQRTDGRGGPRTLPEGARLRLDPRLDISSLGLPPLTRMMAEAAQRHGIIVRDGTHEAIGFFAEDATRTGTDPYHGENGHFGGQTPGELLARFPWERLQVLKMNLCSAAPCARRDSP
jgi:hypothetical protein